MDIISIIISISIIVIMIIIVILTLREDDILTEYSHVDNISIIIRISIIVIIPTYINTVLLTVYCIIVDSII